MHFRKFPAIGICESDVVAMKCQVHAGNTGIIDKAHLALARDFLFLVIEPRSVPANANGFANGTG